MNKIYNLLELPIDKVDTYVLNKKKYIKYKPSNISRSIKEKIRVLNSLYYALYNYVLNKS